MRDTTENYLKIIFTNQEGSAFVKPSILAKGLGVTTAAVTEMLKKLAQEKYIVYSPYHGARLTNKGRAEGQNVVRRHRIWEMYLSKVLGFSWDEVHDEAERLEHASSDALIDRLEEVLKFPKFDPHGDPIPSKHGVMPKLIPSQPLASLKPDTKGRVIRVNDVDDEFLRYISELGIHLEQTLVVKSVLPFDQSMLVKIGSKTQSLSYFAAQNIFVHRLSAEKETPKRKQA
jgi:DtxR family Mn-dependent transcriptional regulator